MATKKLTVYFTAAECTPFIKVGGIADVVGSLPKHLAKQDLDLTVILPRYEAVDISTCTKKRKKLTVSTGDGDSTCTLYTTTIDNVLYVFIDNETYLSSGGVYDALEDKKTTLDDMKRFCFFALAATTYIKEQKNADLVHVHDWHTALIPFLLKETKSILTIHNLGYQGTWNYFEIAQFLQCEDLPNYNGECNILRIGIEHANHITTVSPTYAQEIMTQEYGHGLDDVLLTKKDFVSGIINGIDTDFFNPTTDTHIVKNFSQENISDKTENKLVLQKECGLKQNPETPVIALISRLAIQKGLDLLVPILPKLHELGAQFILLGTGEESIEKSLQQYDLPTQKILIQFDITLAQKIYAGADIMLIPSLFEPCGLTQMIAMRYGTIPIARDTGGLHDTITPCVETADKILGNGFLFSEKKSEALLSSIIQALAVYTEKPNSWKVLQTNAMKTDFSWNRSAKEYVELYKSL